VVVFGSGHDLKFDGHRRIERRNALAMKIHAGGEGQAVDSSGKRARRQKIGDTTVGIGCTRGYDLPAIVAGSVGQLDLDAGGRQAQGGIEDMRGDRAGGRHGESGVSGHKLLQAELGYLQLFGCCDLQLGLRIVRHTAFQYREHLIRRFATRIDDENITEPSFIFTVQFGQPRKCGLRCTGDARLLATGPVTSAGEFSTQAIKVPNSRMTGKGFEPVAAIEFPPNIGSHSLQALVVGKRPRHDHRFNPAAGGAAFCELAPE